MSGMDPLEKIEDIETMYEIIIRRRLYRLATHPLSALSHERIALISLCFMGFPGKTAAYASEMKVMRRQFAGIHRDVKLQSKFRSLLKPELLLAHSPSALRFTSITNIFKIKWGGEGPAPIARTKPPVTPPTVTARAFGSRLRGKAVKKGFQYTRATRASSRKRVSVSSSKA